MAGAGEEGRSFLSVVLLRSCPGKGPGRRSQTEEQWFETAPRVGPGEGDVYVWDVACSHTPRSFPASASLCVARVVPVHAIQ